MPLVSLPARPPSTSILAGRTGAVFRMGSAYSSWRRAIRRRCANFRARRDARCYSVIGNEERRNPEPSRAGTMIVLIGCTTIHCSRTRISKTFGQSFPVTNSLRPAASYAMPFITALRGSVGSGGMRDFSPARSSQPVT